jgi:hypothetical protein
MTFIRNQLLYIITLYGLFVLPLWLLFEFSPYPLPKVQYFVIGIIYLSNYVFFKESRYRAKIEKKVESQLKNELNRTPSKNEIIIRINTIVSHRFYSLLCAVFGVLTLMIIYGEF